MRPDLATSGLIDRFYTYSWMFRRPVGIGATDILDYAHKSPSVYVAI